MCSDAHSITLRVSETHFTYAMRQLVSHMHTPHDYEWFKSVMVDSRLGSQHNRFNEFRLACLSE